MCLLIIGKRKLANIYNEAIFAYEEKPVRWVGFCFY